MPPYPNALKADSRVVNALFASLRTGIPEDVLLKLLNESSEELKFLIAVQPRVSSFSQRARHSLRHPALSMATRRFFAAHRRMFGSKEGGEHYHSTAPIPDSLSSIVADYMREEGRQRRSSKMETEEDLWSDFAMSISSSLQRFLQSIVSSTYKLRHRNNSDGKNFSDFSVSKNSDPLVEIAIESSSEKNGRGRRRKELKLKQRESKASTSGDRAALDHKLSTYDDEDEEMTKLQDREEVAWSNLARCYDTMLRCSNVPCRTAAMTAAVDGVLNDIIRRIWDRITVSPEEKANANEMDTFDYDKGLSDGDSQELPSVRLSQSVKEEPKVVPKPKKKKGGRGKKGKKSDKSDDALGSVVTPSASTFSPDASERVRRKRQYAGTALYMTPLQYIYLHMRMAAVLLPCKKELEIEMLESIQEDLIIDSSYDESDTTQELFFGKAPRLIVPDGVMVDRNPTPRRASLRPQVFSAVKSWASETDSTRNFTGAVLHGIGAAEQVAGNNFWSSGNLPSLSYAQFWFSMMTLADNWTTSAANPIEYASFLIELYSEIFAQDWDSEDETLLKQFQNIISEYVETGEEVMERVRQATSILRTFNEMINVMEQMSSSDSDFMEKMMANESFFGNSGYAEQTKQNQVTNEDFYDLLSREDTVVGKWKYITQIGKDRQPHNLRVREILIRSRARRGRHKSHTGESSSYASLRNDRRRKNGGAAGGGGGDDIDGSDGDFDGEYDDEDDDEFSQYTSSGSEYSVYILEEELDENGEVIARRRRHKHRQPGETYEQYIKPIRFGDSSSDDEFMYSAVETGVGASQQRYLKRFFYDKPAKQLRRIEGGDGRMDDYEYAVNDNLSGSESWSSYSSGRQSVSHPQSISGDSFRSQYRPLQTEAERRNRIRHRVRRRGKRSERRRVARKPNYYYQQEGYDMYSFSTYSLSLDDADNPFSQQSLQTAQSKSGKDGASSSHAESDGQSVSGGKGQSGRKGGHGHGQGIDGSESGDAEDGEVGAQDADLIPEKLSEEQRVFLKENKGLLQKLMASKGITISDEAFEKESEEVVLWQLLQLALQHQKKVDAGEATEDDFGVANFDAALLAKIFTNPDTFSLDDLQRSELMRLLLEDTEGGGMALLTAAEMAGVLAALQLKPKHRLELPSERLRRERLTAKAREMHKEQKRLEKERRRAEKEAERAAKLAELRAAKAALGKDDTFSLTEVEKLSLGPRMPSFSDSSSDSFSPLLQGVSIDYQSRNRGAPKTKLPHEPSSSGSYHLDELTILERRRQEKLYREFEKFAEQKASVQGRFKVALNSYTMQQLEEFADHLHLGPKDRSLLKGRAPLASPSSLLGGTMHQLKQCRTGAFPMSAGGLLRPPSHHSKKPTRLAPMKLYTLTTAPTLKKALWESYLQYVDDRQYLLNVASRRSPHPPKIHTEKSSPRSVNSKAQNSQNSGSFRISSNSRPPRPRPPQPKVPQPSVPARVSPEDASEEEKTLDLRPSTQLAYEEPLELSDSRGLNDWDDV